MIIIIKIKIIIISSGVNFSKFIINISKNNIKKKQATRQKKRHDVNIRENIEQAKKATTEIMNRNNKNKMMKKKKMYLLAIS